jgi:hypothetical protein
MGAAMTPDQGTYRAAKLVIDQRGEEAAGNAAVRVDLLLQDGDLVASASIGASGQFGDPPVLAIAVAVTLSDDPFVKLPAVAV